MSNAKAELRKQYKCPVWTSADGELIPLVVMTGRRLRNCYNHILKRIDTELVSPWAMPAPHGEMAADMWDSYLDSGEADNELDELRHALYSWKSAIESEFERRGSKKPSLASAEDAA